MNPFFPLKQVKIILAVCVILAVAFVIIFPKLHKPTYILERNTYCDGYAIQAQKNDSTVNFKTSYRDCIKTYVKP
jgi:hypothetical protein